MGTKTVGILAVGFGLLCLGAVGVTAADTPETAIETGETDTAHEFDVTILNTTAPVEGDPVAVTVEVENVGSGAGVGTVAADGGVLGQASANVSLGSGESTVVELSIDTTAGDATTPGDAANSPYTLTVTSASDADSAVVAVELPALGALDDPPQDPTGNDKYEDIDGDGAFDIFDVQAFFNVFEGPAAQNHPWAFDFNGDTEITIFDVQSLFNRLSE